MTETRPSLALCCFIAATASALVGCAGATPGAEGPVAATAARTPPGPQLPWARLSADQPSPEAAPQVQAQFGRLIGRWTCTSAQRQKDGSFKDIAGEATWTWFYALDGRIVQDVWEGPAPAGGGVGTNLRVWNDQTQKWDIAWATSSQGGIQRLTAEAQGDDLVMTGDQPARAPFPAHTARITFHTIEADSFLWKYEAAAPGQPGPWAEFSRMSCRRSASSDVQGDKPASNG